MSAPSMVKSCRPTKSKAIRFKPSSLLLMNWYFSTARSGRIRSSPPGRISRAARIRAQWDKAARMAGPASVCAVRSSRKSFK